MYILKDDFDRPFAIIKNDFKHKVHEATKEEFNFTEISMEGFDFPDYVDDTEVFYVAVTEENTKVSGTVKLTKLIDY